MPNQNFIPNSTQIPNVILDDWMAILKNTELRVVLVIARQTLGWIADFQTMRRKERDWISNYQLQLKTGMGKTAIQGAVKGLIQKSIIQALAENGDLLDTPMKRVLSGGKIFYRLDTNAKNKGLFSGKLVGKSVYKRGAPPLSDGVGNRATTKLTVFTKYTNNKYIKKEKRKENREQLQRMKALAFNKT